MPSSLAQRASAVPLLELRAVQHRYGSRRVLREASLRVPHGQLVGIVGENGAGKSTLLKIVAGELSPSAGTVVVRGSLGHCPQEPAVFALLTIDEHLRAFAAAHRLHAWQPRAEELLDALQLGPQRARVVGEVSGGTRQKLNLILALLADPDLLLLDEPYTGFDWETYLRFWVLAARLRDAGRSLLVVSHLLHERARFDQICTLREGRLGP
jgi:ABC-type multidrug transport system ATPase subunit